MAPCYIYLSLFAAAVPVALLLAVLYFLVRPRPVKVPIKGRHVFITGGSSGIGLALAKKVAAEGAKVSILARSLPKLEAARDEIRLATGVEAAIYSVDVRDEQGVKKAVEAAGAIDVLVCNQGVFLPRELAVQDMEEVRCTMDINVMGTFNLIRYALPAMKQGGGRSGPRSIAFVSSQAGQVGIYGYTSYCASKFALRGLAEALQQEVITDNIHVSIIFPPDTETPGYFEELKRKPELTAILSATSPKMDLDVLIRRALNGIKSGTFLVTCNLEGIILSLSTSGAAPTRSFVTAFFEVAFAGFMRFVALGILHGWYTTIEKWHAKQKKSCWELTAPLPSDCVRYDPIRELGELYALWEGKACSSDDSLMTVGFSFDSYNGILGVERPCWEQQLDSCLHQYDRCHAFLSNVAIDSLYSAMCNRSWIM